MSETKFSPGPWIPGNFGEQLAVGTAETHTVLCRMSAAPGPHNEANAHLIAAAPELYEATDRFDEWFRFHAADAPEWKEVNTVKVYLSIGELRAIKAARAKARGES